jgi:hypothetical protein
MSIRDGVTAAVIAAQNQRTPNAIPVSRDLVAVEESSPMMIHTAGTQLEEPRKRQIVIIMSWEWLTANPLLSTSPFMLIMAVIR